MNHHRLKISPFFFDPVRRGLKTFEIRKNDRDYEVGDTVTLCECRNDEYTGREITVAITYITNFLQQEGYIVFAFTRLIAQDHAR